MTVLHFESLLICFLKGSATDERFKIISKGESDFYYLNVTSLDGTDCGSYFCCHSSNCPASVHDAQCQRFELIVTGRDSQGK